ncbi:MAG: hypothetical protein WAM30_12415 [Candidatus Dormiibacterota bacterium]
MSRTTGTQLGGNRIARRDFLRLAGAAGGIAASGLAAGGLPGLATAGLPGGAPIAYAASGTAGEPVPSLFSGRRFPIGMWWPPHPFATTLERYQQIADAGFTFVNGGNYLNDSLINRWALGIAQQTGLDFIVSDPTISTLLQTFSISSTNPSGLTLAPAAATTVIQQVLGAYQGPSSFAGLLLFDEPSPSRYETLANAVASVRSLAPTLVPYINLLPGNGPAYSDYVSQFVSTVRPAFVSFDRYPFLADGTDDTGYFDNWSRVRDAALGAGIPSLTFIQSLGYSGHREPTAAEMLWQINVSLVYGAKGIQYFTYWTPDPARGEGFQSALVTVDGQLTPLYTAATAINRTYLSRVGQALFPLVSELVEAANIAGPPAGLPAFAPDAYLARTAGDGALLGRFRASDPASGDRWLLVANASHAAHASVQLDFGSAVGGVGWFDPSTAGYAMHPASRGSVELAPGAAQLLHLVART